MFGLNLGKYVGISFMCCFLELLIWFFIVERVGIVYFDVCIVLLVIVCGCWILKFVGDFVCMVEGRGVRIELGK